MESWVTNRIVSNVVPSICLNTGDFEGWITDGEYWGWFVAGDIDVQAVTATATAIALIPVISGDANVFAVTATAVAAAFIPSIVIQAIPRLWLVPVGDRDWVVPSGDRDWTVPSEDRTMIVDIES